MLAGHTRNTLIEGAFPYLNNTKPIISLEISCLINGIFWAFIYQ